MSNFWIEVLLVQVLTLAISPWLTGRGATREEFTTPPQMCQIQPHPFFESPIRIEIADILKVERWPVCARATGGSGADRPPPAPKN